MQLEGPVPGIPGASIQRVESLPDTLAGGLPAGPHARAIPGEVLIDWPGAGRYRVTGGNLIEFAPAADAIPGAVMLHLNGTARGALIHQRGELPLHAASLIPPGGDAAIAICGFSGAGKSTLAATLSRRGWTLLADDATRVTWDGEAPLAWPSRDRIKLWGEACTRFGIDSAGLDRVQEGADKYYLPVPFSAEPVRLAMVAELAREGGLPTGPVTSPVARVAVLAAQTCRPEQVRPLGCLQQHMRILSRVAGACRIVRLEGARQASPDELADRLETLASRLPAAVV